MQSILPPGFGIIVRTVAEEKGAADLHQDLEDLVNRWAELHKRLKHAKPGKRVLGELDKTSAVLRDVLTKDCTSIHVNDVKLADDVRTYLSGVGVDPTNIVRVSRDKDLFNSMSIHRQIKAAFGKQVNLRSGAYLIIEQTEAMHVIDVNSGGRKGGAKDQEENALQTNLECVDEIARILRLRDMGGIIAIDFIDMAKRENNKKTHRCAPGCNAGGQGQAQHPAAQSVWRCGVDTSAGSPGREHSNHGKMPHLQWFGQRGGEHPHHRHHRKQLELLDLRRRPQALDFDGASDR
jgi:ribonuclease G